MSARRGEIIRFLAAGGFSAAINFGSRFGYSTFLPFAAAVAVAYLTGMVVAFFLMRAFVFGAGSQSTKQSALLFFAVNLVGVVEVVLISVALDHWLREAVAHAIAIPTVALTSYWGHKHLSFRSIDGGSVTPGGGPPTSAHPRGRSL